MKVATRVVLVALVVLLAGVTPSHAHGGHFRGSIFIGPVWGPGWWGPSYYSPPPQTVVIERQPETYIQQSAPEPEESGYWYYCKDAKAYYPYVKQCPGGWMKVAPSPPPEGEKE